MASSRLTVFAKKSILEIWNGSKYYSYGNLRNSIKKTKQKSKKKLKKGKTKSKRKKTFLKKNKLF